VWLVYKCLLAQRGEDALQRRPSYIDHWDESEPFYTRYYKAAKHSAEDLGSSIYTSLTTLADVKEPEWKRRQREQQKALALAASCFGEEPGVELS